MARKKFETLKQRDKFYIITNGEKTEKNYFKLIKSKKSIYDVEVEYQNEDPLGLVEYANRYVNTANQVWCVFDIDYTHKDKRLVPAINKAKKLGISIAYSNIAFEVWLISHFERCEREMNVNQLEIALNKILKKQACEKEYSKTDEDLLEKYFLPNVGRAVENAKIVYQKFVKAHREAYGENSQHRIWEWNSSTTVFKLIEALKLRNCT